MRWISSKTARWAATAFFTVCWAYALITRFTNFFLALRPDKITMLGTAMVATGLLSIYIFHELLPRITNDIHSKSALKTAALSALAAAALLLFIFQPLYFPEHHLLEIMPHPPSGGGNLTIIAIHRIELPGGEKLPIPPSILDLQGNWHMDSGSDTITWTGDPEAKISFARLMQAGIEVLLKVGPQQGKTRISWDGQEHILNLYAPIESTQSIVLIPALDWHRADLTRKVLVSFALAAEFLGLTAIICIFSFLPKVFTIRNFKTIIVCTAALLLLIPLVYAADPPVQFQDSNLEASVREILKQPDGVIRQHKLLTIAKLDASSYEIVSLEGIQHLRNLASLNLRENHITDINPLRNLNTLRELNLRENFIQDLEPLSGLTGLVYLNVHSNPIDAGLATLSNLERLETLIMRNVNIGENYHFLADLTKLQNLNIRNTSISDLSIICNLMEEGALQDNISSGIVSTLNILENTLLGNGVDPYEVLRPYWDNITYRYPINLPYFPSNINPPIFSQKSGFYMEGFYLTLSTDEPGGRIYYTLDGAEPSLATQNKSSLSTREYTSPILVQSRAGDPNLLSNIYTSEPGLYDYNPPSEIFKANIVRAIVIDEDMHRSNLVTHTYFVDEHIQNRYTFPILSISTDPDGLFDDEVGIYVPGNLFENITHPNQNPANYTQRGLKWERPAYVQMFNQAGEIVIAQNAGIRINGDATRWFAQKSLRLYAGEEYDSQNLFNFDFFPALNNRLSEETVDTYETIILRNSGQDCYKDMFQDAMAQSLLEYTTLDIQGYQPVIVFINGEYWGIHNVRTRYDEYYFQSYYGIQKEDLAALEENVSLRIGGMDDIHQYEKILTLIDSDYLSNEYQTVDTLSDPNAYRNLTGMIDVDNLIDVYISQIYYKNTDWPGNNVIFWRKKFENQHTISNVPNGHDGKWRWMVNDTDFGFKNPSHNTLFDATRDDGEDWYNEPWSTFLIRSLLENHGFKISFISRFSDHLNTTFREEVVVRRIDQFEELYLPEIEEHIHRWGPLGRSLETWQANIKTMREFAQLRPTFLRQHITNYFSLPGIFTITLLTDSAKGHIRINSIDITPDTPGVMDADQWSGTYFEGIPISLSAIPKPGYQFAGWEGIDQSNPDVYLILNENLTLTAVFIPAEK